MTTNPTEDQADRAAISDVVDGFLASFTSGPDSADRLARMRGLFLPEAIIIRTCGGQPTVYDLDAFIAPRQELLAGGRLTEFSEWPLTGHTQVFGDIAQHFASYAKAGVQDGSAFSGCGVKSVQLVRTSAGWRISAVAWDDERPGVELDPALRPGSSG